jgi:hypothetical protein
MNKKIIIILYILFFIPIVIGEDNVYIINENSISINNQHSIILQENGKDLKIDENNIYVSTINYLYNINKHNGIINYKVNINNIMSFELSDNYIYIRTLNNIYKVNKLSGSIDDNNLKLSDNIYTYLNLTNGTNGINQSDNTKVNKSGDTMTGTLKVDVISSDTSVQIGVPLGSMWDSYTMYTIFGVEQIGDFKIGSVPDNSYICTDATKKVIGCIAPSNGINGTNGTNGINRSDDTKVNKTGDTITGMLNMSHQILNNSGDIYQSGYYQGNNKRLISYQAWDLGSIAINFFSNGRKYNSSSYTWEYMDDPAYPGASNILFGNDYIFTTFPANSVVDTRQFEYTGNTDNFQVHANLTIDQSKHIAITTAGQGIQLTSPDGNPHCITVSNLNIVNSTAGACT